MKKVVRILLCILILGKIAGINPIAAAQSGKLTRPFGGYQGYFQIDSYSGGWEGTHYWWGVTKIGDNIAYCIDPTRHTTLGASYIEDDFIKELPNAQKNRIWQIAYFGYGYGGDLANERYLAAQELIWEEMNIGQLRGYGGNEKFAISWIDTADDIKISRIEEYKKVISDLMNDYLLSPSFKSKVISTKVGDIITLSDDNSLLDRYEFTFPASVKMISQNKKEIVFEVIDKNIRNEKISFKRKDRPLNKVTVVWGRDDDQKLFTAGLDMFDEDYGEVKFAIPYGNLKIQKTDDLTGKNPQGSATLAKAEFSIYDANDSSLIEKIFTDEKGIALSSDLLSGSKIKICETKAPSGYIKTDVCQFVTIAENKTIEVTFANKVQSGTWQGIKTDAQTGHIAQGQATLSGAVFAAYQNGIEVERLKTGIDGYTPVSKSYPIGTKLEVCEIIAPEGYDLSENPCRSITIKSNANISVEVADEVKRGKVVIEKSDAETGRENQGDSTFEGIRFVLSCDGFDDLHLTMDQSGIVASEAIYPYGSVVKISEITNDCFTENKEIKSITINDTEEGNYVQFVNQVKKGRIEIVKFIDPLNSDSSSEVKVPGQDFKFAIYLARNNSKVAEMITDSNGRAISPKLPYGSYIVKEIGKIDDPSYELIDDFTVEIKEENKTYLKVISNVQKSGRLKVVKRNGDTNIPVKGMKFKLYYLDGKADKISFQEEDEYYVTDDTGSFTIKEKLGYGNYLLEEIQAPEGLMISSPVNVVIDDDLVVLDVVNESIKGEIIVKKTGRIFKGCNSIDSGFGEVNELVYADGPVAGTKWSIYAREDIYANDIEHTKLFAADQMIQTVVTDKRGEAIFDPLPLGKYYIQETETPPGLILDQQTYYADITEEKNIFTFESFNDSIKTDINLTKILEFKTEGPDYTEVIFGLFRSEPLVDDKDEMILAEDQLIGLIAFDDKGKPINTSDLELPAGNYYLKELAVPDDYIISEESYPFEIKFAKNSADIIIDIGEIVNIHKRYGNLYLNKQGEKFKLAETSATEYGPLYLIEPEVAGLKSTKFELTADCVTIYQGHEYQKGEVIKVIETDDSGNAAVYGLPVGQYLIREIETADNYVINQEAMAFKIDYRDDTWLDEVKLTIKNERKKLYLEFEKIFENDDHESYKNTIFGLFSQDVIYDDLGKIMVPENGLIMLSGLKNENGHYIIEKQPDLPCGSYYLKELSAAEGYEVSDEVLSFNFFPSNSIDPIETVNLGSIINHRRELDIFIHKRGNDNIKLDGAIFDIFINNESSKIDRMISGGIYLEGEAGTVYELSLTADFTECREYIIDNHNTLIIDDLSKGVYYVRKKGDDAIRRYQIDKGLIFLSNIPYGSRLIIKEVKAPTGYIIDDEPFVIDINAERNKNDIAIDRINDLIIVPPKTGMNESKWFLIIVSAGVGGYLAFICIRHKKRSSAD